MRWKKNSAPFTLLPRWQSTCSRHSRPTRPGCGFLVVVVSPNCNLSGNVRTNLDLLADGPSGVVAVESKCLETLTPHVANFASAYEYEIKDQRRQSAWFREMQRLVKEPKTYRWLDAAQLVKHAFGVAHTFPRQPITLLYIFWEPANANEFPNFAEHRDEVTRFAESISGGGPEFVAMSYPELWRLWDTQSEPEWLYSHVQNLRLRYGVVA